MFLEILQNSKENNCARISFLIKLQARPATLLKKRFWHRCFPVNFAKFLRTPFLQNTSWRLLPYILQYLRFSNVYIYIVCFYNYDSYAYLILVVQATKKDQSLSLFSFNWQFNVLLNLSRIDDWKPWIKKIKIWQVNWTEQVELNRISYTNVITFNIKNF